MSNRGEQLFGPGNGVVGLALGVEGEGGPFGEGFIFDGTDDLCRGMV
jgi:hypothetical protein